MSAGKFHLAESRQIEPHRKRDMAAHQVRAAWHVCCQSSIVHRFDCPAADGDEVSGGPFLPLVEVP